MAYTCVGKVGLLWLEGCRLPEPSAFSYPYPADKDYPADAEHLGISARVQHAATVGSPAAELALSL
jgi:hypothetical protein